MALNLTSLYNYLGLSKLGGKWGLLAIIFTLLNLKSVPLGWHVRLLRGILTHISSSRKRIASKVGPDILFQPMIITSRSGFLECDYNLHKSNSTYFSDFDVGRLELLACLIGSGMTKTRTELSKDPGSFAIMLGGVSCNFKREIKPYEGFEIWSRVLCWDGKWLYIISHFVKKGAVKPTQYTLQPWKRRTSSKKPPGAEQNGDRVQGFETKASPDRMIYASAIAKYVFKKGRLTIPPERVLGNSELLPPKPTNHETPPATTSPSIEGTSVDAAAASTAQSLPLTSQDADEVIDAAMRAKGDGVSPTWDWDRVEAERERGMKIAELFAGLDALNDEFRPEDSPALGQY